MTTCRSCGKSVPADAAFCPYCSDPLLDDATPTRRLDQPTLVPGSILEGRYRIIELVGRGGMGVVYSARDLELERDVAIKLIPDQIFLDPGLRDALKKEANLCLELTHPNIVRLHDYKKLEGRHCLVMELVRGGSLAGFLAEHPQGVPEAEALPLLIQACRGIAYAHQHHVIHRDIKPGNLLVGREGEVKVADFGIARVARDSLARVTGRQVSGTPVYMSPEQLRGKSCDARSDIYSLGCTFYELLSGRLPFSSGDITYQHLHEAPEPIPGIGGKFWSVVARMIAKEPAERFQSVEEVIAALEAIQVPATALPGAPPIPGPVVATPVPTPAPVSTPTPELAPPPAPEVTPVPRPALTTPPGQGAGKAPQARPASDVRYVKVIAGAAAAGVIAIAGLLWLSSGPRPGPVPVVPTAPERAAPVRAPAQAPASPATATQRPAPVPEPMQIAPPAQAPMPTSERESAPAPAPAPAPVPIACTRAHARARTRTCTHACGSTHTCARVSASAQHDQDNGTGAPVATSRRVPSNHTPDCASDTGPASRYHHPCRAPSPIHNNPASDRSAVTASHDYDSDGRRNETGGDAPALPSCSCSRPCLCSRSHPCSRPRPSSRSSHGRGGRTREAGARDRVGEHPRWRLLDGLGAGRFGRTTGPPGSGFPVPDRPLRGDAGAVDARDGPEPLALRQLPAVPGRERLLERHPEVSGKGAHPLPLRDPAPHRGRVGIRGARRRRRQVGRHRRR